MTSVATSFRIWCCVSRLISFIVYDLFYINRMRNCIHIEDFQIDRSNQSLYGIFAIHLLSLSICWNIELENGHLENCEIIAVVQNTAISNKLRQSNSYLLSIVAIEGIESYFQNETIILTIFLLQSYLFIHLSIYFQFFPVFSEYGKRMVKPLLLSLFTFNNHLLHLLIESSFVGVSLRQVYRGRRLQTIVIDECYCIHFWRIFAICNWFCDLHRNVQP